MKALGIVFSNIHDKTINELTAMRTLASVPFGGRYRLIDFVLSNMVNSGLTKVGVVTKNNYQSLMDHIGSGKDWDLSRKKGGLMVLPPYGAADSNSLYASRFEAIKGILTFIKRSDEDYVVMSDCDNVCNIDFAKVVDFHVKKHADYTIIYRKKKVDPSEGKTRTIINFDSENKVIDISNSSKASGMKNVYTNMLVINRKLLVGIIENVHENGFKSFLNDVLIKGSKFYNVYAYEMEGYFASIDSLANYYKHSMELLKKDSRDSLFNSNDSNIYTKVRDSAPCKMSEGAIVSNSLIADGCIIDGEVTNSILFRGVRVAKGAKIKDSILMQDTSIGTDSLINCVVADKNVVVLDKRSLSGHETRPYFINKNCVI